MRGMQAVVVRVCAVALACGVLACGGGGGGGTGGSGGGGHAGGGAVGDGGGTGGGAPSDGGAGPTVSCTNTQGTMTICTETSGAGLSDAAVQYLQNGCLTPVGDTGPPVQRRFDMGPCSRTHALGGCSTTSGTNLITTEWWYAGGTLTVSDVHALCDALGDPFVAP